MNDSTHEELLARHFAGETDDREERIIEAWRAANPDRERAYRELAEAWKRTAPEAPPAFDVNAGWGRLVKRLAQEGALASTPSDSKPEAGRARFARRRFGAWAMSAAAVAIAALGLWLWRPAQERPEWQVVAVPAGGQVARASLPDGTTVRVNAGSELRWRKGLAGETREVLFRGQGYFEVAPGERLFFARTDAARIRVVGTRFEIWARHQKTRVTVLEGTVALRAAGRGPELTLTADQAAAVENGSLSEVRAIDSAAALGWLEGRLTYYSQKLVDVLADLSGVYGVDIELADPALGDLPVTAVFRDADLETALGEICLALNLRYVRVSDGFRVSR